MTRPEAKAAKRVRDRREDIPTLLQWLKDGTLELERAVAGYTKYSGALQTVQGETPDNREQGLPIDVTKASADGVHVIDVVTDFRDIAPQYIQHVLIPFCDVHARKMRKAARLLNSVTVKIYEQVSAVIPSDEDESVEELEEPVPAA